MGRVIALDSMVFIYLFEEDVRYSKKVNHLFEQIETGQFTGVTSIITPLEVLSNPRLVGDSDRINIFTNFFKNTSNLKVESLSWEITLLAAKLRRENIHLKTPDSIQLSTAQASQAEVFITNDKKLLGVRNLPFKILPVDQIR